MEPPCKCGASLSKTTPAAAYGNDAICNSCRLLIPSTSAVFHCPKGRTAAHELGYDYCLTCAERYTPGGVISDPYFTGKFLKREKIVWQLDEEQIISCAATGKGEHVSSAKIQFSNDTLWNLDVFPRGTARGSDGFMALLLRWDPELNQEVAGIQKCVVHVTLKTNGEERNTTHTYDKSSRSMGFPMGRTPVFGAGNGFAVEMQMSFFKVEKAIGKQSLDDWFSVVPYTRYRDALQREGYDSVAAIRLLDDGDLQRLGVSLAGHRRVFLRAIAKLNATG